MKSLEYPFKSQGKKLWSLWFPCDHPVCHAKQHCYDDQSGADLQKKKEKRKNSPQKLLATEIISPHAINAFSFSCKLKSKITTFPCRPVQVCVRERGALFPAPRSLRSVVLMREDWSRYFSTPRPQWESRDGSDARHACEEPAAYPDTADRTSLEYTPLIYNSPPVLHRSAAPEFASRASETRNTLKRLLFLPFCLTFPEWIWLYPLQKVVVDHSSKCFACQSRLCSRWFQPASRCCTGKGCTGNISFFIQIKKSLFIFWKRVHYLSLHNGWCQRGMQYQGVVSVSPTEQVRNYPRR